MGNSLPLKYQHHFLVSHFACIRVWSKLGPLKILNIFQLTSFAPYFCSGQAKICRDGDTGPLYIWKWNLHLEKASFQSLHERMILCNFAKEILSNILFLSSLLSWKYFGCLLVIHYLRECCSNTVHLAQKSNICSCELHLEKLSIKKKKKKKKNTLQAKPTQNPITNLKKDPLPNSKKKVKHAIL